MVILETYECNDCGGRFEQTGQQPVWRVGETRLTKCYECRNRCIVTKLSERLESDA